MLSWQLFEVVVHFAYTPHQNSIVKSYNIFYLVGIDVYIRYTPPNIVSSPAAHTTWKSV